MHDSLSTENIFDVNSRISGTVGVFFGGGGDADWS